jgi:phage/plasmid-like protein (TIGR03299 family)
MVSDRDTLIDKYVHEPAFALVGRRLDHPKTAQDALIQSGLDFTVAKRPLRAVLPNGKMVDVPDKFATVSSRGQIVGTVGKKYSVVQPAQHFEFFDPIVSRNAAVYVSAGLASGGRKLWLLAKLPSHIRVGRDDIVNKYILIAGSFDGSLAVTSKICPIRFSCQNQLSFALRSAGDEIRIRHTETATQRLAEASRLLGITDRVFNELGAVYNRLATRRVSEKDLMAFVSRLVPDNPNAESNARTKAIRQTICDLAVSGVGSNLNRMTAWSCLQGSTEWVDHCLSSHNAPKRFDTIFFGGGQTLKKRAFALATEMFLN